ncbi:mitochondrial import inner membrane translocase subunit TIM50-like isoform X1 [Sesamum indicum]|uniref:Mitochondrial import inner membrane translocase subunit TIM50 n=1 Tax=Sesamum indicum TaxID=4182 RepID=A0A8M8V746_SESIN|nr:mitochondrial import inner membrane translocase subunit TIM50-like isoform X1 [Sesamum indicum]
MSAILRTRARLYSIISRNDRRFSSPVANEHPREPIISSSIISDQTPEPPSPAPPAPEAGKKSWTVLKYGLVAALTGGIATAGYATYAYSLDEIDQKTKALRASANYTTGDDASSLDVRLLSILLLTFYIFVNSGHTHKLDVVSCCSHPEQVVHKFQAYLQAAAMTVPAKLVDIYLDLRRLAEEQVRGFTEPTSDKLLPDLHPLEQHVFTLVLDLNETLIYSDWKRDRGWRTFKRPGVDAFLEHLAQFYEIVVYSDQLSMYVDPVVERLDTKHCIRYRLSRGATRYIDGKHYRDLSMLNRDPAKVIYISGHALESSLQPENCIEVKPWKGEADDTALLDLIPFLEYVARHRPADIRAVLASYQGCDIAKEFIERSKEHQRRMQEQKKQGRLWRH